MKINLRNIRNLFRRKEKTVQEIEARTKDLNTIGIRSMQIDEDVEMELTPHNLMFFAYAILENFTEMRASYEDYTNFLVGRGVKSNNEEVQEYLDNNNYLQDEFSKSVWNYLVVGNTYVQKFYNDNLGLTDNSRKKLRFVQTLNDSSRVYYNLDATSEEDYWLYVIHYTQGVKFLTMKVPNTNTTYKFRAGFYWVKYALSQMWQGSYEYCMPLAKDELVHLKNEYTRNAYYGFSNLMASWNYSKAQKEIISNIFRIAKYRAIGKKLVSVGDGTQPVTNKELERIESQFYSDEKQIMFVNKPIKIDSLTYEGEYNSMRDELDYIRKAMMSGSVPATLTSFSSDLANRSLSDNSMKAFFIKLEKDRNRLLRFWNDIISELMYGDKNHDLGLYLDAPTNVGKEGDVDIKNAEVGKSKRDINNPEESLKEKFIETQAMKIEESLLKAKKKEKKEIIEKLSLRKILK